MSYYEDLSPYNYHHHSEVELNIGWLQKDQPFVVGKVPEGFLDKLKKYSEDEFIIFQTKGMHSCEFCQDNKFSSNEMRIIGSDNSIYASPYLIIHYIEQHNYLPPQEFISAVLEGPEPGTESYNSIIKMLPTTWKKRRPDTNDENYEEKMRQLMIEEISQTVSNEVLQEILKESEDFKKLVENYRQIIPSVYGFNRKK